MAENIPGTPGGSVPPKPSESSKVQPKKETVRINLPPKPSAAPTIKLPTLPAGGPSVPGGAPQFAPHTPPPAPARTAAAPTAAAAVPTAQRAAAPRAPMPSRPTVSGLDKALAIAAAVAAAAAVGTTFWMTTLFTPQ